MQPHMQHRDTMIITIVCDVLGEENNGTTIAAMNLFRFLKAQGHTVRILCADQDKKGMPDYYVVPVLNMGGILNRYVERAGVALAHPDEAVIRKALVGADIVHVMMPFSLGVKAAKVAKRMGLPVTAGFHVLAQNFTAYIGMHRFGLINRLVHKFIYAQLFSRVDAIHYPTKFVRDIFEGDIRRNTNGYVISNGVHDYVRPARVQKPAEMADKTVIVTTGRYSNEKAQDVLIKAVKHSKYKDSIQLILAGMGVREKHYRKLADRLPVKPIFKFYPRGEIIDVLNYADLYVHTADAELEGIACTEAIVCGKLTISSDSRYSATKNFVIDEKCLFRRRNPKDLAQKIDYWIEHPAERAAYEQKYLTNSCSFEQHACMLEMQKMLMEVIHGKKR